jgi:hypothetical protein
MVYFEAKNTDLGKFFEGLAMEDVGIFCGHLVNFPVIWYILCSFGGMLCQKSGNPGYDAQH